MVDFMPDPPLVKIKINSIKKYTTRIGLRNPQILSLYLFGSVARDEADALSDLDLLFLVPPELAGNFFGILAHDPAYFTLESWILSILEGGINPLILDPLDLVAGYDTLISRIEQEGILLYGKPLHHVIRSIPRRKQPATPSLLELVESL